MIRLAVAVFAAIGAAALQFTYTPSMTKQALVINNHPISYVWLASFAVFWIAMSVTGKK